MTDATDRLAADGGDGLVDPALAEGRSRLVLFAGMGGLAVGTLLQAGTVVRVGVVVIALGFALNTAGKLTHYRALSVPRADRLRLAGSWLLLALSAVGLLANFAHGRYGPGEGSFFLPLAVAAVGFGLLHMAAQSKYLPAEADAE